MEPGPHREMVAPLHGGESTRRLAARHTKRPEHDGTAQDWKSFSFKALMLFDECQLEATVTMNDVRKTSDEPADVMAWRDDNSLAFTMLSGMINTKKPAGDTLMKKIMKKFPAGERQGDELWKYIEEKHTQLTKAQVKELKGDLKKMTLDSNDPPSVWENKMTEMQSKWSSIPEHLREGDESSLSEMMIEKVPKNLSKYSDILLGMTSVDGTFLEDSDNVMSKLIDLHRIHSGKQHNTEGGRAYVAGQEKPNRGASAFKFTGSCHNCGMKGHKASDCKLRCKYCGMKGCGGVKGITNCMVKNGIPPNAKIPPFIADRIENRAKEMKKMKGGAMLAYNEESGNDSSDNNETDDEGDGAAFVATCYWVDANGIAHLNDGDDEDGDDHEQGTDSNEHVAPVAVGEATENNKLAGNPKDKASMQPGTARKQKLQDLNEESDSDDSDDEEPLEVVCCTDDPGENLVDAVEAMVVDEAEANSTIDSKFLNIPKLITCQNNKSDGEQHAIGEQNCVLPGCELPAYVEADGRAHECCGRTHAAALAMIKASYAVPLKKFTGKSSIIELGFSSTSEEETDNEDVVVPALTDGDDTVAAGTNDWFLGATTAENDAVMAAEDEAYKLALGAEQTEGYQNMLALERNATVTVTFDGNAVAKSFHCAATDAPKIQADQEERKDRLLTVVNLVWDEEMNNNGLTAEERGAIGHAVSPTLEVAKAVRALAPYLDAARIELASVRAVRAVIARKLCPTVYTTVAMACSSHSVSKRSFATWLKRIWKLEIEVGCRVPSPEMMMDSRPNLATWLNQPHEPAPLKPAWETEADRAETARRAMRAEQGLNEDGSRTDGYGHDCAQTFAEAQEAQQESLPSLLKAKACAKVADAPREGADAGEQQEEPNATEMLTRLKRRVRELDQLEPKDGRLATRERYEILATVAKEEMQRAISTPSKSPRTSTHATPRTARCISARDRAEDELARNRIKKEKKMDFQTAHQRHGGEDRQLSRVAYLNKVKNMSPKANLVTYGAGKIPSNLIEYFDKTDPGSNGKPAARRQRRSPRAKFGTHHAFHARSPAKAATPPRAASAYRTPERKILSFNSPRAPGRRAIGQPVPVLACNDTRQMEKKTGGASSPTRATQTGATNTSRSWLKALPALMILALSLIAGFVGGLMGNAYGSTGSCAGYAMMAKGGTAHNATAHAMRAVVDGGCTHVCFNDREAFAPGTLREPDKPTYMLLGDDTRVPVKGIGTLDINLVDSDASVRYTRGKSFYTPDMTHNLIPERKEWRKYQTRVRKEDENMMHLSNGSVRISDDTGLYTVAYQHVHANHACIATLTDHEKNYLKYHIRLGHPSKNKLKLMARQCTGAKQLSDIPNAVFDSAPVCPHCLSGKMRKKSLKSSPQPDGADKRVVMDVWGPFRVPSAEYGYHYLIGFTHEESGYTAVYPTRRHATEDLIRATKRFRGDLARYTVDLKILRTDNGPEMSSQVFQDYLAENLITWERSAPYVHEQIGLQERRWGMIIPKVIAMLKQAGARLGHWASAARYAAHLVNMEPLERPGDKRSPIERLTGRGPDLAPVRTYYSKMWGAVSAEQREHKLSDRAIEGRFVGLAANGAAWVLYSTGLTPNRHFTVVQATFDETDVMGAPSNDRDEQPDLWPFKLNENGEGGDDISGVGQHDETDPDEQMEEEDDGMQRGNKPKPNLGPRTAPLDETGTGMGDDGSVDGAHRSHLLAEIAPDYGFVSEEVSSSEVAVGARPDGGGFSLRPRMQANTVRAALIAEAQEWDEFNACQPDLWSFTHGGGDHDADAIEDGFAFISCVDNKKFVMDERGMREIQIPTNHAHAMSMPEGPYWRQAERVEIDTIENMDTYDLVPEAEVLELGEPILNSKMAYDVKTDEKNNLLKWKARGVVVGSRQQQGINYEEVFSATVRFSSIRIILAIAAVLHLVLHQFDIKGAYLHAEMDMVIYMRQFQGHERHGPNGEKLVCRLRRALYGSKQAGRLWRKMLAAWLIEFGFMQCAFDECCYVWRQGEDVCLLGVFVDDIILATSNKDMLIKFTKALKQKFNVDDRGELKWALGMLITRDWRRASITISCEARIKAMVERYAQGGHHNKTYATPADKSVLELKTDPMTRDAIKAVRKDARKQETRSLIGALIFVASVMRVDIAQAVSRVARHIHNPDETVHAAAIRILLYLNQTKDLGITYGGLKESSIDALTRSVHVLVDASWEVGCSVSGIVLMVAGGAAAWVSRKQAIQGLSSPDVETYAASAAAADLLHQRGLMQEFGLPMQAPTTIWSDNSSTVAISNDAGSVARSRHLAMRARFLQDFKTEGEGKVSYIRTEDNAADALTKPLERARFTKHRQYLLGMIDVQQIADKRELEKATDDGKPEKKG